MTLDEMKNDTDVLAYLRSKNAVRVEEAAAKGWTFYSLWSEDLAEQYATVYEFELDMARSSYSDFYKEVNGFRPSISRDWDLSTLESKITALADRWED